MITISLEKGDDSVWLSIDHSDWEISREAFTQLCYGLSQFDESDSTSKEIRLDVSDDDHDDYSGEEY